MAQPPRRFLASVFSQETPSGPLERRSTPRHTCDFGVLYTQLSADSINTADGAAIDVSESGIGICGGLPVSVGDLLLIVLYRREGEAAPVFHMEVSVAWSEGQRFGVRIVHMRQEERALFQEMLRNGWCQCGRSMRGSIRN